VIGGLYSNPNDLAFAIVLSLPFALAFMVTAKNILVKTAWGLGMLVMLITIFETASRAGFIDLVILRKRHSLLLRDQRQAHVPDGRRRLLGVLIGSPSAANSTIASRPLEGDSTSEENAYGSYQARMFLMGRALDAIESIPFLASACRTFPPIR
jgi:hypothetical protein